MSVAREYIYEELHDYGWSYKKKSDTHQRYEEQHDVPHVKKYPMKEFFSDGKVIVSKRPVVLTVAFEDEQYYATNDNLNIFAVGDSISSVVEDFSHHIVHFYEYYTNKGEDEIVGNALRLKEIYDSFQKLI